MASKAYARETRRTTIPGPTPAPALDLVHRSFSADRPDKLWLADFTYIRTWAGWSYLAVVLDVHTRRIVGWQLASHMRQSLVTDAFEMALAGRQKHEDGGMIAHSDNGSQYTSYEYTKRLVEAGIASSRGRTGTALDNAMAESVISTIKTELIRRHIWRTRLQLELALVVYIGWYNTRRLHRAFKGRTPLEVLDEYNQLQAACPDNRGIQVIRPTWTSGRFTLTFSLDNNMGALDTNDTLPYRDAWNEREALLITRVLSAEMMPTRWGISQSIYETAGIPAQFMTYSGVGHRITDYMLNDIVAFLRAHFTISP